MQVRASEVGPSVRGALEEADRCSVGNVYSDALCECSQGGLCEVAEFGGAMAVRFVVVG